MINNTKISPILENIIKTNQNESKNSNSQISQKQETKSDEFIKKNKKKIILLTSIVGSIAILSGIFYLMKSGKLGKNLQDFINNLFNSKNKTNGNNIDTNVINQGKPQVTKVNEAEITPIQPKKEKAPSSNNILEAQTPAKKDNVVEAEIKPNNTTQLSNDKFFHIKQSEPINLDTFEQEIDGEKVLEEMRSKSKLEPGQQPYSYFIRTDIPNSRNYTLTDRQIESNEFTGYRETLDEYGIKTIQTFENGKPVELNVGDRLKRVFNTCTYNDYINGKLISSSSDNRWPNQKIYNKNGKEVMDFFAYDNDIIKTYKIKTSETDSIEITAFYYQKPNFDSSIPGCKFKLFEDPTQINIRNYPNNNIYKFNDECLFAKIGPEKEGFSFEIYPDKLIINSKSITYENVKNISEEDKNKIEAVLNALPEIKCLKKLCNNSIIDKAIGFLEKLSKL